MAHADDLSDISSDEDDDIFFDAMDTSTSSEELLTEDEIGESEDDDDEEFELADEWQDGFGQDFDPTFFYILHPPVHQLFPRYHSHGVKARVTFQNMEQLDDAFSLDRGLEAIFDDILRNLLNSVPGGAEDLVGVEISHPDLHRSILVPFKQRQFVNGRTIATWIEKVLQSHDDINLNELEIKMIVIHQPVGGRNPLRSNWQEWFEKHSGGHGAFFVEIINTTDNLCLARALVYARAQKHPTDARYQWHSVRRHDQKMAQKTQAEELMELAGLKSHTGLCGIEEMKKIQTVMPDFQIKVYSKDFCNMMIFKGPEEKDERHTLHIYHHDNHYTVISSICGFMNRNYYCNYCDKGYNNMEDHRCGKICPCCYTRDDGCKEDPLTKEYCTDCNRYFRNQECFNRHKVKQQVAKRGKRKRDEVSLYDRIKCCRDCGVLVNDKRTTKYDHICGYVECRICKEYVEAKDHQCYIRPLGKDEDDEAGEEKGVEKVRYVFFDFEATQEDVISETPYGPMFEHKTNLCIAHICCSDCLDNKDLGNCPQCKEGRKIFIGRDCQNEFCMWLFDSAETLKKTKTIAIAHNMKGYDGQFILQYLHQQALVPTIVPKGLAIMSIAIGKTKIIDSLNFIPARLADLPKTFGITEMKKGHFPHLFNKVSNWNYEGPLPDASDYAPAAMKPEDRNTFYQWYRKEEASKKVFNFQKEIIEYCESDVDILRRCCLAFRKVFMESTGLDPFMESLTIAAACNKVYRTLFLEKQTIGIVPHGGYRRKDKYSNIAIKWIKWVEEQEGIRIQNATNGGEATILTYKVDGLHEKTIYEFNGCWWHGCPRCMNRDQQLTADGQTAAGKAFENTQERKKKLEAEGYTVIEKWECDLKRELLVNLEMADFFDSVELMEPMDPREGTFFLIVVCNLTFFQDKSVFFQHCGRTNATKLYHKCAPGEKIHYIDVVSLYPWVCKYGMFPLGHPEVILENFETIDSTNQPYRGLIKATILPPTDLHHPLLPMHCNGKLLFTLCRTCAKEQQKVQCNHDDNERAITGAWCHPELYKAIKLGYQVLKVHEVYNYKDWEQYDEATQTGGLFTDYINKFLKMKQEADGWPSWCQSDSDKDRYIADYYEHEGIKLEKAKIAKNPGFRALAKLMLNSFWGKFGQRNNMSQTVYFKDPEPFCSTVFDPTNKVSTVNFINDNMVTVSYTQEEDFIQVAGNTNVIIAAFTTAQARLKLYSYIEQLQERVLYFDTDSVIYLSKRNQWEPEIGSYLGMMSNELKDYGPGAYISEFVSGGPKNYAYKIQKVDETGKLTTECKCKVRGFSLLSFVQNQLNFKSMRRMVKAFVQSGLKEEFTVVYHKIGRIPIYRNVITTPMAKRYRVVYDKRVVNNDFSTLPYGYNNDNLDALIANM